MTDNYSNLMGLSAYDILKVPTDADVEQIKSAFKKQMLSVHTDKPTGNDVFAKLLNAARDALLGDRAAYDSFLEQGGVPAGSRSGSGNERSANSEWAGAGPTDSAYFDEQDQGLIDPDPWEDLAAPDVTEEIFSDSGPGASHSYIPVQNKYADYPPPNVPPPPPLPQSIYLPVRRPRRKWPWVLLVLFVLLIAFGSQAKSYVTSITDGNSKTTTTARPIDGGQTTNDSLRRLQQQAAVDRPAIEARLANHWVPQISSRKVGPASDDPPGVTADEAWANHQQLRVEHPEAVLAFSSDWATFRNPDYWVTLIGQPFETAVEANTWCDLNHIGPDDCFAKRLAHSGDPADNTLQR